MDNASATADASNTFHYTPLDKTQPTIRLVHILPDLARGMVQCQVQHTKLDATTTQDSNYVCLSYVWGRDDPTTNKLILMNGRKFSVRFNLFKFLEYMREASAEETHINFWIDALCIDQTDTIERNHQVAQMGEIYSKADKVYIWLGTCCDMRPLLANFNPDNFAGYQRSEVENLSWSEINHICSRFQSVLRDIYWDRAWITQEVILARQAMIVCQPVFLGVQDLLQFARRWLRVFNSDHLMKYAYSNGGMRQFDFENSDYMGIRGTSMIFLLNHFREKRCSDPRDRVFSLLSLCDERYRTEVDYGADSIDLAYKILLQDKDSICICSAALLVTTLHNENAVRPVRPNCNEPCLEVILADCLVYWNRQSARYSFCLPRIIWENWERCTGRCASDLLALMSSNCLADKIIDFLEHFSGYPRRRVCLATVLQDLSTWQHKNHQSWSWEHGWYKTAGGILLTVCSESTNLCSLRIPLRQFYNNNGSSITLCPPPRLWRDVAYMGSIRSVTVVHTNSYDSNNSTTAATTATAATAATAAATTKKTTKNKTSKYVHAFSSFLLSFSEIRP